MAIVRATKDFLKAHLSASLLDRYRSVKNQVLYLRDTGNRRKRAELEKQFQELNRGLPPDRIALRSDLEINVLPDARFGFEHFCFRELEPVHELDEFRKVAKSKKCFLDIGALHGIFSLVFLKESPEGTALALDPSPIAFSILQEHLQNHPRAIAMHVGAGDKASVIRMSQNWHHYFAVSEEQAKSIPPEDLHEVSIRTLDSLIEEHNLAPDLVKLDVEGFENSVLLGAPNLLSKYKPIIFLELHPMALKDLGSSLEDVLSLLTSYGYQFFWNVGDEKRDAAVLAREIRRGGRISARVIASPSAGASLPTSVNDTKA